MKPISKIITAAIAATFAFLPLAEAGARDLAQRHDAPRHYSPQRPQPPAQFRPKPVKPQVKPPHVQRPHVQAPHIQKRKWARGHRFQDWKRYSEVRDYKRYGLKRPAAGQRWVKVDNDYLLVTIATGIIAGIIAGR